MKKYLFAKESIWMYICFKPSNKEKETFYLGFHKNIKSLVPIFMKNCMSQSLTRKQRVRKICI